MEGLLRPVSTAYKADAEREEVHLVEAREQRHSPKRIQFSIEKPRKPEEALEALKSEPDFPSLGGVLDYLVDSTDINLNFPSPLGSQIINVLVSDIVPNYWTLLSEKSKGKGGWSYAKERSRLLQVLRNVSGLGAIVAKLKALIEESRKTAKQVDGPNIAAIMGDYIEILGSVLENENTLETLHATLSKAPSGQKQALWQEVGALIAGGRVVNIAAEAQSLVQSASKTVHEPPCVSDGMKYSTWIGRNLAHWAGQLSVARDDEGWAAICALMRKSMRLGYQGDTNSMLPELEHWLINADIIQEATINFSLEHEGAIHRLLNSMPALEQKPFLNSTIRILTKRYLSVEPVLSNPEWYKTDSASVAAVASFIQSMVEGTASRTDLLISWLTALNGAGVGEPVAIRRSVIGVAATNKFAMEQVLEKSMQQFGDQLYIKHTPSLQQDGNDLSPFSIVPC